MSGPVRNETDYSKHVCSADPHETSNMSSAAPEGPAASGVGPLKAYVPESTPSELPKASAELAKNARKPSPSVAAARTQLKVEAKVEKKVEASVTQGKDGSTKVQAGASVGVSVEATLSSPEGDASLKFGVSKGPGASASFEVRDVNQDGAREVCVEASYGWVVAGACAPLYEPPPVDGTEGASGSEQSSGTGGSGGW